MAAAAAHRGAQTGPQPRAAAMAASESVAQGALHGRRAWRGARHRWRRARHGQTSARVSIDSGVEHVESGLEWCETRARDARRRPRGLGITRRSSVAQTSSRSGHHEAAQCRLGH